jgi:DNA-binding response OmpR family regulator
MTTVRNPQRKPVVLLVDDDVSDAQLVKIALTRTPGEVTLIRIEDGDQAVAYLTGAAPYNDREKYPLPLTMLLDIKLPKRSGLELLQWLRSQAGPLKRLPVMMLTSSSHRIDVNRAFERGANFTKPEALKDLVAMLADLKSLWLRWLEFPDVEDSASNPPRA